MANRPVRVVVRNNRQIICPIRFVRAVVGGPQRDAPDVDDRGFAMGARPGTWGASDARGAMVGITTGDEVRVRVLRGDIDDNADLYVTSTRPDVVRVTAPAGGGPLPADGVFRVRGLQDLRNVAVAIQVRLGGANGPVLAELEPHIFNQRSIRLTFHFVTIYGTGTNRNAGAPAAVAQGIHELVRRVNDIWRPAGAFFTYTPSRLVEEHIRRNATTGRTEYRRRNGTWAALPAPLGAGGQFQNAGTLTSDARWATEYREFDTLMNINAMPNTVNIYCVHDSITWDLNPSTGNYEQGGWSGLSDVTTVAQAGQPGYGIAITDGADLYDLAHELGHYLGNNHSDENAAGTDAANGDMWIVRRLMYSAYPQPAPAPAWRRDVGYGVGQYGALIAVKDLAASVEVQDGEIARSRPRARRPY